MPVESLNVWAQFGLGGVVIAALFAFIVYVVKEHRLERETWINRAYDQHKEWVQAYTQQSTATNEILRDLSENIAKSNLINQSRHNG